MLNLNVVPATSLGNEQWELVLGMPINHVIQILQREFETIHQIQISYNDSNLLDGDIVLNLSQDGIRLFFDAASQRLKIIQINDTTKVHLSYGDRVFCSEDIFPTREQIESTFGATLPPEYDPEEKAFHVTFPGLAFTFQASEEVNLSSLESNTIPESAMVSTLISKMAVFSGKSLKKAEAPPIPLSCFEGGVFIESVEVLRDFEKTNGIELQIVAEGYDVSRLHGPVKKSFKRRVVFGDTVQEVLSALGSPRTIFFKEEDKMKIHSQRAFQSLRSSVSDYFFNYYTLGIDVLFDGKRHVVKKFVLHSNFPGHYDFSTYLRCSFRIPVSDGEICDQDMVTTFTKWRKSEDKRPVVLNPTSSDGTNPFGSTYCYGHQDLIFEVMKNGYIASVILYQQ